MQVAHNTTRGDPCALPGEHRNRHRTVKNYGSYLASKRKYGAVYAARDNARWRARHPVESALSAIRTDAKRRGAPR